MYRQTQLGTRVINEKRKNKSDSGTMSLISNLFSHPSFMKERYLQITAVNELKPDTNNSNYDKLIRRLSSTPRTYPLYDVFWSGLFQISSVSPSSSVFHHFFFNVNSYSPIK